MFPLQPPPGYVLAQQLVMFSLLFWGPTFLGVYSWANEAVKKGRVISSVKVFLVISTLSLVTVAFVICQAYALHISIDLFQLPSPKIMVRGLSIAVYSCLDFFPIYTLLKRKLIPYKIFMLTVVSALVGLFFLFFAI